MKHLKFSFVDNDFAVNAKTDLTIHDDSDFDFVKFLRKIKNELITGETAFLEVEGLNKTPVTFTISHSE
jgi:hypothetical protein